MSWLTRAGHAQRMNATKAIGITKHTHTGSMPVWLHADGVSGPADDRRVAAEPGVLALEDG
jgi:hypothetical protein